MFGNCSQIFVQPRGIAHECGDLAKQIILSYSYVTLTLDSVFLSSSLLGSGIVSPYEKWLRLERVNPFVCCVAEVCEAFCVASCQNEKNRFSLLYILKLMLKKI